MKEGSAVEETFAKLANKISQATGSFWTFSAALLVVLVWAGTGPLFDYSETWQLVINTGTTIITFLMVFIIQHAQNKDMRAVQLKLNELIAAVEGASNRLIDVEDLTDRELEHLYSRFQTLAKTAQKVSQGAKLSIDSDPEASPTDSGPHARDSAPPPTAKAHGNAHGNANAHGHAHSEDDKQPVASTAESKAHSKKRRH